MQNPSFGRFNRVRIRRNVGTRWRTKSSRRRREAHKETKRYRGFLTSSDIGTYPAHAVLTEKFRWVSVIFRGCGRLITPCAARPFSRAPRGVTARTLRVLLTPFTYCNTRKPMHSQNAPLNYRVIASPLAIRRLKTSMYVNASPFFPFVPFSHLALFTHTHPPIRSEVPRARCLGTRARSPSTPAAARGAPATRATRPRAARAPETRIRALEASRTRRTRTRTREAIARDASIFRRARRGSRCRRP